MKENALELNELNQVKGGDGKIIPNCGCDPAKPHTCIPPNCPTCMSGLTNDPDGIAEGFLPNP